MLFSQLKADQTYQNTTMKFHSKSSVLMKCFLPCAVIRIQIRTRTAQLFFALTAQSCYSEKELSCSDPIRDTFNSEGSDEANKKVRSVTHKEKQCKVPLIDESVSEKIIFTSWEMVLLCLGCDDMHQLIHDKISLQNFKSFNDNIT